MERKHQCFANTQTTEDLMLLCYTQRFYVRQLKPLLTGKISIHSQIKITVTFLLVFTMQVNCSLADFPPQLNFYFYLVDVMLGNTWGSDLLCWSKFIVAFLLQGITFTPTKWVALMAIWENAKGSILVSHSPLVLLGLLPLMSAHTSVGQHQFVVNMRQLCFS